MFPKCLHQLYCHLFWCHQPLPVNGDKKTLKIWSDGANWRKNRFDSYKWGLCPIKNSQISWLFARLNTASDADWFLCADEVTVEARFGKRFCRGYGARPSYGDPEGSEQVMGSRDSIGEPGGTHFPDDPHGSDHLRTVCLDCATAHLPSGTHTHRRIHTHTQCVGAFQWTTWMKSTKQ